MIELDVVGIERILLLLLLSSIRNGDQITNR